MEFLVGAGSMFILDSVYLSMAKPTWRAMIKNIQGTELKVRMLSAVGVYVLMSFGLYYFIIKPKRTVFDAALLGLVIYGVFDLTNHAIFSKYNLVTGLTDMVWGSVLFASTAYIVKKLMLVL